MKKTVLLSRFALLTFWVGLSLGYHEGKTEEQRAWSSTAQVERTEQGDFKIVYKIPHSKVRANWRALNRPDARSYEKYERVEP
jgi:hypothetical protein